MKLPGDKVERWIYVIGFLVLCFIAYAMFTFYKTDSLVIKSPYAGYQAGYDEVYIKQDVFCAPRMRNPEAVELHSTLFTNREKYLVDPKTKQVTSKGRDYLYEGKYEVQASLDGASEDIMVSIYDTQPPIFTKNIKQLVVRVGIQEEDLAEYFPIFDYDDRTTLVLFKENIDFQKPQKVQVTAIAHDSHGNNREEQIILYLVDKGYKGKLSEKVNADERVKTFMVKYEKEKEEYKKKLTIQRNRYISNEKSFAKKMGIAEEPDFSKYDSDNKKKQEDIYNSDQGIIIDKKKPDKKEEDKDKEDSEEQEPIAVIKPNSPNKPEEQKPENNTEQTKPEESKPSKEPETKPNEIIKPEEPSKEPEKPSEEPSKEPEPEKPEDVVDIVVKLDQIERYEYKTEEGKNEIKQHIEYYDPITTSLVNLEDIITIKINGVEDLSKVGKMIVKDPNGDGSVTVEAIVNGKEYTKIIAGVYKNIQPVLRPTGYIVDRNLYKITETTVNKREQQMREILDNGGVRFKDKYGYEYESNSVNTTITGNTIEKGSTIEYIVRIHTQNDTDKNTHTFNTFQVLVDIAQP